MKQRQSSPRWACACRWRRRGSRTSTRASISAGVTFSAHTKRGTKQRHVYTYPSKNAIASIKDKVRAATQRTSTNQSLADLCVRLNPALRGWTTHFRHDVSKATFSYLRAFLWKRKVRWLRKKHPRASWKHLRRLYLSDWWPTEGEKTLFNPSSVPVTRYRYRGERIPSPWAKQTEQIATATH